MMKTRHFILGAVALIAFAACGNKDNSLPRAGADADVDAAVDAFVEATVTRPSDPDHIVLHSVMLLKHGQVIAERWMNGAAPEIPHAMHSVSKTFVAAAAGLAIGEGKMNLDDKVVGFFPDKLPSEVSDNLAAMTVRDLLTMNCGQSREPSGVRDGDGDWVEGFLAYPVEHEPGTFFAYNSLSTYMVSAIIQKVTGEKVVDYLDTHLFQPLGIEKPQWEESPQGINCGGWGLSIKTEDMARMGQMLLDGGKWKGSRILPEEWTAEMTKYQVSTARPFDKRADWTQGYAYFMWVCTHDGVRADGSEGQYIIVLPKLDAVIVLTTDSTLYQPYLDMVWEFLLPALR